MTLGFWERFGLGLGAPQRDWISIVGDEVVFERDTGANRVWRFADGDAVGVYFFDVEPDLPKSRDLASFVSQMRDQAAASHASLLECDIVRIGQLPAVRQIAKVPQRPSGMTYLGAFTLPFAKFSYVLKVQCEEHGVTGIREAVLLDHKLKNKLASIDPVAAAMATRSDADSEEYDVQFPNHPLSRLRRHLRYIPTSCRLHVDLLKHPGFQHTRKCRHRKVTMRRQTAPT
jgi:hypothetical protein